MEVRSDIPESTLNRAPMPCDEAKPISTERRDLKEASRNCDVLEEVGEFVSPSSHGRRLQSSVKAKQQRGGRPRHQRTKALAHARLDAASRKALVAKSTPLCLFLCQRPRRPGCENSSGDLLTRSIYSQRSKSGSRPNSYRLVDVDGNVANVVELTFGTSCDMHHTRRAAMACW